MATVPGPRPDRPFPPPGVPAEEPRREEEEHEQDDTRRATPEETPSWQPEPYDPEREHVEPAMPAAVP